MILLKILILQLAESIGDVLYNQELGGGGIQASMENTVRKAVVGVKARQMPKLAPQFDGLECFETFVGR